MSPYEIGAIIFGLVFFLLLIGTPVAVSLGLGGVIGAALFLNRLGVVQYVPWHTLTQFVLIAIPLFIFMGQLMLHSGMGARLYDGAGALLRRAPGGLLHANIASCAVFAAVSGSTVATSATIGVVAIPELERRGYDKKIVYGSLAGGGCLGILIPPSITMIVYGAFVGVSVGSLFIAGIFPGIMLSLLFMLYIGIRVTLQPQLAPRRDVGRLPFKEVVLRIVGMWPIVLVMAIVLGGIYLGVMTPTETAAVGSVMALVIGVAYRKLTWSNLLSTALDSVKTGAFIMFIILGAMILSATLAMLNVPEAMVAWIIGSPIPPLAILVCIYLIFIFLGCFIDGISIMLLTLPVVYPVVISLGFDPIWFGITMVLIDEMAMLTPPVGLNVYVIHGLVPHRPQSEVVQGSMPFFFVMIVALVILVAFPVIATWLPGTMRAVAG